MVFYYKKIKDFTCKDFSGCQNDLEGVSKYIRIYIKIERSASYEREARADR